MLKTAGVVIAESTETNPDGWENFSVRDGTFSKLHYHLGHRGEVLEAETTAELALLSDSIDRWMSMLDVEDRSALEMTGLHGQAHLVKIDHKVLQRWQDEGTLHFREPAVSPRRLINISTPLRPELNDAGPVILVQLPHGERLLANGNHRVFQALQSEDSPVYALEFVSPEAFTFACGVELKRVWDPISDCLSWGKTHLTVRR